MKKAIRHRSDADRKARAYARLLPAVLTDAATAAGIMDYLNKTYNVDVSTQTLLVHTLTGKIGAPLLTVIMAESQPSEETVLFNQVPDGNGGQPLSTEAIFGELVAAGSVKPAVAPGKVTGKRKAVADTPAPVGSDESAG
jgi:hypothetical protein